MKQQPGRVTVGTNEEIGRHDWAEWLARNVCQGCDGGVSRCGRYFATVAWLTAIPSLPFSMNPRRTPERIRGGHATNQRAHLGTRGWTTWNRIPTLPTSRTGETGVGARRVRCPA